MVEQKTRFEYTLSSFDGDIPETVGDFIEKYNEAVEALILVSNFGFSAVIDQADSALEKHEQQQHELSSPGVQ